jgi:hypothetical protein
MGARQSDAMRQSEAKSHEEMGSVAQKTLRELLSKDRALRRALEFLFSNPEESLSFQDLRFQPLVPAHRNPLGEEAFFLPKARFGGTQDVAMASLIRTVVDETLRDYAATAPHLLESVGKTPISPMEAWA